MHANQVAEQIKSMKGLLPEPNRTVVAHRFMRLIGQELADKNLTQALAYWQQRGALEFKQACELTAELPRVADTLQVDATALATFCNKWHAVEMYRPKGQDDADWIPISAEMNNLRQTMIAELEELSRERA